MVSPIFGGSDEVGKIVKEALRENLSLKYAVYDTTGICR
jgi:hypothetical protein